MLVWFKGNGGKLLAVNPRQVRLVWADFDNPSTTRIIFDMSDEIAIAEPVDDVIAKLNAGGAR